MDRKIIFSGISAMFLLWSCGTGQNHDAHDHSHEGHNHETEAAHSHDGHDHDSHDHGTAESHAGHSHKEEAKGGHSDEITISPEKAAAAGIQAQQVTAGPFREIIHTNGKVVSASTDETAIVATTDGTVSFSDYYTEGMSIAADQEIFSILSGNLQDGNRIEKARIAYEAARQEYERASKLTGSKIVSQKEYAVIKENYENAKLAYEALRPSKNGKGVAVTAPFKGSIKSILVKEGDFVTTGTPLASISMNRNLILEADLSQKYYGKTGEIVAANFSAPYSEKIFSTSQLGGRLLSSGKSMNDGKYYIPVSFGFKNPGGIIPGSFVEIWLLCKERKDVLTLPLSAITEEQGLNFVYLKLDDECYRKQEVVLGANDGIRTEILKGLTAGDNVVTEGAYNVKLASASNAIPAHTHSH